MRGGGGGTSLLGWGSMINLVQNDSKLQNTDFSETLGQL